LRFYVHAHVRILMVFYWPLGCYITQKVPLKVNGKFEQWFLEDRFVILFLQLGWSSLRILPLINIYLSTFTYTQTWVDIVVKRLNSNLCRIKHNKGLGNNMQLTINLKMILNYLMIHYFNFNQLLYCYGLNLLTLTEKL